MATMMVLKLISTNPNAGLIQISALNRVSTASGIATILYLAAQIKFWIIFL